jgi:hypothetical protein
VGDPIAGVLNTGRQTIDLIDRYVRSMDDADAQDALANLAHEYGVDAVASAMSSRQAAALLDLLQRRLAAARTADQLAALTANVATMQQVLRASQEREARTRRIAWGVGLVATAGLVGGGVWYWRRRHRRR